MYQKWRSHAFVRNIQNGLSMFESTTLTRILGATGVIKGSSNVIYEALKSATKRLTSRTTCRILVDKLQGKWALSRSGLRWEGKITEHLKEACMVWHRGLASSCSGGAEPCDRLLCSRYWTFLIHKGRQGISLLAQLLSASQTGVCSHWANCHEEPRGMWLIVFYVKGIIKMWYFYEFRTLTRVGIHSETCITRNNMDVIILGILYWSCCYLSVTLGS